MTRFFKFYLVDSRKSVSQKMKNEKKNVEKSKINLNNVEKLMSS